MNKKLLLIIVLVLSLALMFAGCSGNKANVVNGDFSSFDSDNLSFEGWDVYGTNSYFSRVSASDSDQDKGKGNYIKLSTSTAGVNYLYQTVKLKQGATYKISVDIKTSSKISGEKSDSKYRGAWVGFVEDTSFCIEQINSTNNTWKHYEKYFSPATSHSLTLAVGIGHDEVGKAKGTAYFDNIVIEEVDESAVPSGSTISTVRYGSRYSLADGGSIAFVVLGAILSIAVIAFSLYLYRKNMAKEMLSDKKLLSPTALFIYVMLIAFAIRFVLAVLTGGMVSYINELAGIVNKFGEAGAAGIMANTETTLPVGMLYMLWAISGLSKLFNISGDGLGLLIRLPFILADIVAVYLIYSVVAKYKKEHTAAIFAGVYAVMPSVIMASTGWGMEISLVACLLIGMSIAMLNKNYIAVSILFTVALLFGNITILLLPLVLAFFINAIIKNKDSRIKIGVSSLISLIVFYAISVPFMITELGNGKPFYLFETMYANLTELNVFTSNAFNLYGIFGMNNIEFNVVMDVFNYLFVIALFAFTLLCYFKNRNRLNIILMASFTLIAVSALGIRASVETMVLGIALLFLYAVISNSRRIYALFGGFSILSFLNVAMIMSNSGFITNQINSSNLVSFYRYDAAFIIFSIIAVVMTLYFAYVVIDVCVRDRTYEMYPLEGKLKDDFKIRYDAFKQRIRERKSAYIKADNED